MQSLISERGRDASVVDWLAELTADCSIKQAQNWSDHCNARCPDLQGICVKWLKTCRLLVGVELGDVTPALDGFLSLTALQHHGAERCILT
jgi:hypothetical protein